MLWIVGWMAGCWTTLAGMGGGILMVLGLSAAWESPEAALAVTTPALLLGNLHRLWLFFGDLDRRIALAFAGAALPGSIAGGFLAVQMPSWVLQAALAGGALLAVAKFAGLIRIEPSGRALAPAGAGIGAIGAALGGGGFLVGPFLLATGLSGSAYLATMSISAVAMHSGRLIAYGAGGWVTSESMLTGLQLALAIMVGNASGAWIRAKLGESITAPLEKITVVALVGFAFAGLV